ncbi:MAG: phospho-N-acetylmuramoyl-pentapeptide-transferase [Candidatus Acetothermia bacterium]
MIRIMSEEGIGQQIRSWGPNLHEHKSGTPTMGGLAILAAVGFSSPFLWFYLPAVRNYLPLFLLGGFGFGLVGCADDLLSILNEQSRGLKPGEKILLQLIVSLSLIFLSLLLLEEPNRLILPFSRGELLVPTVAYYPLTAFVLIGTVNAVNLTDGLDGLAGGAAVISLVTFAVIGFTELLPILFISIAGIFGFLWYNFYPAELFLGDTGAFALGGIIATAALVTRTELLLPFFGGLFALDTFSVMIQVLYYKSTGERVFKISPLHHHFEPAEGVDYSYLLPKAEWPENKVTGRLWIVQLVLAGVGLLGYFYPIS